MRSSTRTLQGLLTWAGLALVGLVLVVVILNLAAPVPLTSALRGPWVALKVLCGAVLLISWVFLNLPEVKPPAGQFVLAVAELGEWQPADGGWQVVPSPRSAADQIRALLPTNLPALPTRAPAAARPARVPALPAAAPPGGNGTAGPRSAGEVLARPPLLNGPGGNGEAVRGPGPRPPRMPQSPLGATAWLVQVLNTRWSAPGMPALVCTEVDCATDGASARALGARVPADVVLWGVLRAGRPAALWANVVVLTDLEARAQAEEGEMHLAGLRAFPLGPLASSAPEIVLSLLTGLGYYAAGRFQAALNEWNLSLITAIVAHDNPPETALSAVAVAQFYRGNAAYLLHDATTAADAYEQAIATAPRLAEAQHNLALAYHALGRLDQAHERIRAALRINPHMPYGAYNLGVVLLSRGRLVEAADLFGRLLAQDAQSAEIHRALGLVHRGAGRPDQAEQELREALRLRPAYAEVYMDLAALYNQLAGMYAPDDAGHAPRREELLAQARAALQQALELRPANPDAHYNYGLVLNADGQIDAASDAFREALRLRPDFPEAHYALGVLYKSQGQFDQAVAQFKEATALKPANAETFVNLGLAEYGEGRYEAAAEKFRQALTLEPHNAEAHYRLGLSLARLNDAGAIGHLQAALMGTPAIAGAAHELAAIFRRQNRYPEALAILEEQLKRDPRDAQAHYGLGSLYVHQGRLDAAIPAFQRALQYAPDHAAAHYNLGVAYVAKGRLPEAIGEFEQMVALTPDDPQAHYVLGVAYKDLHDYVRAVQELEAAVRRKPDFTEAHYNLGLAYHALSQPEEAIAAYRAALHLEPGHPRALYRLGTAYAATGQLDAAIGVFQRLVDAHPELAEGHYNLGVAYSASQHYPGAIREFSAVIGLRPDDAEAYNQLGLAYKSAGRLEEAVDALQQAVARAPGLAQAYYNLGQAYTALNEIQLAVQAFRHFEEYNRAGPTPAAVDSAG